MGLNSPSEGGEEEEGGSIDPTRHRTRGVCGRVRLQAQGRGAEVAGIRDQIEPLEETKSLAGDE